MGGTMYDRIMRHAGSIPSVGDYFGGRLDREEFRKRIASDGAALAAAGLDSWAIDLLRRMPQRLDEAQADLAARLHRAGITTSPQPHDGEFQAFRGLVESRFAHLESRFTSIFPEEARVAFELSLAIRPKRVVVCGSYYAFLSVWLVPGLGEGGTMTCFDPDESVSNLARNNMESLGLSDRVDIRAEDAVAALERATADTPIDLLVLDAYGSTLHPDPAFHGKAIYAPLLQAALPALSPDAFLLVHNANRDSRELVPFYRLVAGARHSWFLDTTEHLAVFGGLTAKRD